jgi:hypothetical protein
MVQRAGAAAMSDLVVTVPKDFWLEWIDEGDAAGSVESGEEWGFFVGYRRPDIIPGERLYVVAWGRLRGYAPVTRVARTDRASRSAAGAELSPSRSLIGSRDSAVSALAGGIWVPRLHFHRGSSTD